jgi:hexosaminidase
VRIRSWLGLPAACCVLTAITVLPFLGGGAHAATVAQPSRTAASAATGPAVIPKPVSMTAGSGRFTLTPATRVSAGPGAAGVAKDLAAYLRPATGYPLRVTAGNAGRGTIALAIGPQYKVSGDQDGEGYRLTVTPSGVTVDAATAHGLYNGVQTFRQLLPAQIASPARARGPWTIPATRIIDYPRYAYRGLMLDIARHYETPQAVERLIDQAAAYKINTFHLHLSDDQGFRIAINGFPNLTAIGAQGSVGTGGRTEDPGGYWTQAQYKSVVADAEAHFMTLIPEVDSPGHNNAIIMSEYNDTANPLLNGDPQDIDCGADNPPQWDYTGDVGYSALCPDSPNTWTILDAIIRQIDALTPGSYHDLGGDEVPSTVLSQSQYASLVNKEASFIQAEGKTVMGWADIAGAGTSLPGGSVAEYWEPASGSASGTETGTEAVAKNMKIVMAPASHAYLDQKYTATAPTGLGQTWACPSGCDVDQFYDWDPASYVTGVTDANVIGVEGALWTETVTDLSQADEMIFPRLPALAEVAWSPKANRTSESSPAYQDFITRLAAQGPRWKAAGINFYPTPEVPWPQGS